MVAYLNRHRRPHGSLQIVLIPAGIPVRTVSRAGSRDAHQRTVERRQPLDCVQIDLLAQCGHDDPLLAVIPRFAIDLPSAFSQAAVADKAFLAFSQHGTQRLADNAARQQGGRQKRQILLNDGRLQGHAAGGNHHRLAGADSVFSPYHQCRQIRIGFANPHPCITQSGFALKQCIDHVVAQLDLLFPDGHTLPGKNTAEDRFGGFVGLLFLIHVGSSFAG